MNATRKIRGQIGWLKCSACRKEFPVFIFSGDVDMSTDGLCSSVDLKSKKIYIYEAHNRDEFCRKSDCIEPELLSVEREVYRPGESFQEFLRRSRGRDVYKYRCPICCGSDAVMQQKLTKEEVSLKGYEIVLGERLDWGN